MRNSERTDIYTRVTNEIVAAIEAGAGEWRMPWHHDGHGCLRSCASLPLRRMLASPRLTPLTLSAV